MILNKILKTSVTLRMIAVMLLLAVAGQSCRISYKLNGSAIDYTVYKTIYIGQFPIRAALVYAPLQQTFELNLQDYITRNNGICAFAPGCYARRICLANTLDYHCQSKIYR